MSTIYDFEARQIDGRAVPLKQFKDKVLLVVNTASACGFTPQFSGLEELHKTYGRQGLVVLGFPCNQFGKQEPGSDQQIVAFCSENYKVKFPLFSKIDVNGEGAAPLYKYLTALETKPTGKGKISWNFEKFVVGKNGEVVARFAPRTEPDAPEVLAVIEAELAKK